LTKRTGRGGMLVRWSPRVGGHGQKEIT
jgi:hypothetical protein